MDTHALNHVDRNTDVRLWCVFTSAVSLNMDQEEKGAHIHMFVACAALLVANKVQC